MAKKTIFIFIIAFLVITLNSCANLYSQPGKETYPATVKMSSVSNGFLDWRTAKIKSIDDQIVIKWSDYVRVAPGNHLFVIDVQFNRSFFDSGPYQSFSNLSVNLQAGKNYQLNSLLEGAIVKVWLEDESGRRITPVSSSNYQAVRQYTPPTIIVTK